MKASEIEVDATVERGALVLRCSLHISIPRMHSQRFIPLGDIGSREKVERIMSELKDMTRRDFDEHLVKFLSEEKGRVLESLDERLCHVLGVKKSEGG